MKRDKYIRKALKALNLIYDNSTHEFELNTIKDIDFLISSREGYIRQLESAIEESNEAIEQCKKEKELLLQLKHQVKVEEYKELNPGKDIY